MQKRSLSKPFLTESTFPIGVIFVAHEGVEAGDEVRGDQVPELLVDGRRASLEQVIQASQSTVKFPIIKINTKVARSSR